MKKVLIAHQSTIPHYRVDFYNALEKARPQSWQFEVVFDPSEIKKKRFFQEEVKPELFTFPIVPTNTFAFKYAEKIVSYQTFWKKAASYDLVIVGSALSNITYPLCQLHQLAGTKFAVWGHGRNRAIVKPTGYKKIIEKFRSGLARKADGFFGYTPDILEYLGRKGVSSQKIFILNNTIDIHKQRHYYEKLQGQKERLKEKYGLSGKKVLLFVGRCTKNKKLTFLVEAFLIIEKYHTDFHLVLIGSGASAYTNASKSITALESITDLDNLAPYYAISEVFVFPGDAGLGPLQALCYDLPVITRHSPTHMPEFAYLSAANAVILPQEVTPQAYAQTIIDVCTDTKKLDTIKQSIWPSIQHLTIENMALNFVKGVNTILQV
jgi:glycosyltransferase involved in cell wall biosynthesis